MTFLVKQPEDVPALRALDLVFVETAKEGSDLVSLAHRSVLASGDDFTPADGIPIVYLSNKMEAEAARAAGVAAGDGWPGWDAIFDYLIKRPHLWRPCQNCGHAAHQNKLCGNQLCICEGG
jgi:hypothetical protein